MAQTMAHALCYPGDPKSVGAQMGYPYYVQWTGAGGGYRQAKVSAPACPMRFIYGKYKPFMFHSSAWAEEIGARPGNQVLGFNTGHYVMIEEPEESNHAVITWLAGRDAGA